MRSSLKTKIALWFFIVVVVLGTATWLGYRKVYGQIRSQAESQMDAKLNHALDVLKATNQTYLNLVHSSMRVLKLEASRLGEPSLQAVPDASGAPSGKALFFGTREISRSFALVDEVKRLMGGTATIFQRDGNRFVRISTNIQHPDGGRATGTELDPKGRVISEILDGKPFYGVVNILGKPYITGYEPILDASGTVIGTYYVGYALEALDVVHQALEEKRVLNDGFFALLDPEDQVIFPDRDSPIGIRAERLLSSDSREKNWWIVRETFQPWNYEVLGALYLPDILEITLQITWQAGMLVGGVVAGVLLVSFLLASRLSDALERAEVATRSAIDSRDAAEAANRTKSTFLANMSHELRTPMNAIIGYSEMLIEEAEDLGQDDFVPDLQKIRSAGKHLLALINDILDLSKIEAGKMTVYFETFNIREMIEEVVGTVQPLLDKNKNRLELQIAPDIGKMHADLTKVRQTLFNLLSNATKFTENGDITVSAGRLAGDSGDRILIGVKDTGIGMTGEQLGRLFQAFSQADASTTRKYGGTGLGLVISRKFCQMMGGDIHGESRLGEGSTFTVDLPAEALEPVPPNPPAAPENARTILVIDDDPDAAALMARTLERNGFATLRAGSGTDGIELARRNKPSAVTLDVMMPGMDGWSVLSALKGDPSTSGIPVIMVTMLQDRQFGYALGADDFLTKPVDSSKLRDVISRHVGAPGRRALVVEDDPANRDMLARLLRKEGLEVETAENGSDALEQLARQLPSVILLDLMMPVMDGFEFLSAIRREPRFAGIPVIVVTAKDLTSEDKDRLNGGVAQVFQKGAMDREKLLSEVCAMLRKSATK